MEMDCFKRSFGGLNVFEALPEMQIENFVNYRHHVLEGFRLYESSSAAFKLTSSKVDFTTRQHTDVS